MKIMDYFKTNLITAFMTFFIAALPGYLYLRGLPIVWTITLFTSFVAVAIMGVILGKMLL